MVGNVRGVKRPPRIIHEFYPNYLLTVNDVYIGISTIHLLCSYMNNVFLFFLSSAF